MFKYQYLINYRCRPNKKTLGSQCALNVTTSGKLESDHEQRKVLTMLARVHRVNLDAIELGTYTLTGRIFKPRQWVMDKVKSLIQRALGTMRSTPNVRGR